MTQSVNGRVSEIMAYLKDYVSAIKAGRTHPFSTVERQTRAATRNERWGPSGTMLNELAELSFDEQAVQIIFAVLEYRMKLPPARWQNVYKALLVLHFLLTRGSQRAVTLSHQLAPQLSALAHFRHVDAAGRDCGADVQHRSQVLRDLLADEDGLNLERQRCVVSKSRTANSNLCMAQSPVKSQDRSRSLPGCPSSMDGSDRNSMQQPSIATYTSSNAKSAVTPAEAKLNLDDLQKLLSIQSNRMCADCQSSTTAARPSWASINTGAFLCMRCAGIHRGLGVHVSQVRSCSLDIWLRHQVDFMAATGNATANAHWEATLNPASNLRPPRDSPALEKFIRLKYCEKAWVLPSSTWPPANALVSSTISTTAAAVTTPEAADTPSDIHAAGVSSLTSTVQITEHASAAVADPTTTAVLVGMCTTTPPGTALNTPTKTSQGPSTSLPPRYSRVSAPQQSVPPLVSLNGPITQLRYQLSRPAETSATQQQQQQQHDSSASPPPDTMDLLQLDSDDGGDYDQAGCAGMYAEIPGFSLPLHHSQATPRDPFQHHCQHPPSSQSHHPQHHLQYHPQSFSADNHHTIVEHLHTWVPVTGSISSSHNPVTNSPSLQRVSPMASPLPRRHNLDPFHASVTLSHRSSPPPPASSSSAPSHQHNPIHPIHALTLPQAPLLTYEWQDFNSPTLPTHTPATLASASPSPATAASTPLAASIPPAAAANSGAGIPAAAAAAAAAMTPSRTSMPTSSISKALPGSPSVVLRQDDHHITARPSQPTTATNSTSECRSRVSDSNGAMAQQGDGKSISETHHQP